MTAPASISELTLGERMTLARRRAGIGVGELAGKLGRHRNSLANWEHDRIVPEAPVIFMWAALTGVTPEYLERGELPAANVLEPRAPRLPPAPPPRPYRSASDWARELGLSISSLTRRCQMGRVPGAQKVGNTWIIPDSALPELEAVRSRRSRGAS